ncbi:MAG: NTP transferase domain-containing protein [Spirochaetes bacterium]|nr:NTP transferase domain-containing protein [Spirochaetota bacterium]
MSRDYVVLQVRISSTRLPGKLLLPLCGVTIFEHILRRLKTASKTSGVVVATTAETDPFIRDTAKRYGAGVVVGSEEDVLSRYVTAVEHYRISNVVRATGDNPLVSIEYLDRALELHAAENADLTVFPDLPYGTGIEVIKSAALLTADGRACDPSEREHITKYLYNHPDLFRIVRGRPEPVFLRPELRLTIDTKEDYDRMVLVFGALYRGAPIGLGRVIEYLDTVGIQKKAFTGAFDG